MRFTVLGASGFIGKALAAYLGAQGHEVYAPGRGDPEIFSRPLGHVIYCIGLTADFRAKPYETVRAHVGVLADVLENADFDSLLYLSSTRVYARQALGDEASTLAVDPSDPSDLYNLSKLTGESLCGACGRSNVRIARLSNVIGLDPGSDNFLFALVREAVAGQIWLHSDPDSAKDYILLKDVVSLLPQIAAAGKSRVYNVASGIKIAHREVMEQLAKLTGCALRSDPGAQRFDFPSLDTKCIRSEFGFEPAPVLEALPEMVEACRNWQARK